MRDVGWPTFWAGWLCGGAVFALVSAALLAKTTPEPTDVPTPAEAAVGTADLPKWTKKFCDQGRAIYITPGARRGGIAIVENAAECQPAT